MDFINTLKKVTKITNFASSIDYVTLRFIPALTLVCGLVMTYKQYAKSSISCYSSSPASGNGLVDFVENFCYFAERFYELPSTGLLEPLPFQNIYPFLPIIMLLQTATLCLPKIFWVFFGNRTELSYLLKLCLSFDINGGYKSMEKLLVHFDKFLIHNGSNRNWNCHLLMGYFFTKLFSLIICGANLIFLYNEIFLKNALYPAIILKQLLITNGTSTATTPMISIFQQVVMCKVTLSHIGSENNLVAQCILTFNRYYEKVFAFVTLLIVLSMALTLIDLMKWAIYYVFKQYVLVHYLDRKAALMYNSSNKKEVIGDFIASITVDLYFTILMIATNINSIIATEVLNELYITFKTKRQRVNSIEKRQLETLV
jgi:hypothetical protein